MRSFSKIEKEFIAYLVKSERGQRNVMSFLDSHLERTKIKLDFDAVTAEYRFEVEKASDEVFGWIINKTEDLQEIIAIILNLVVYLKDNGYIAPYKVTPEKWSKVHEFGRGVDDNLILSSPFPDDELVKVLIEYAFKEIVPLEPLKDLGSNDYVTPEERRFRTQYRQALVGIVVAIVVGSAGIWFNYISIEKQESLSVAEDNKTNEIVKYLSKKIDGIVSLDKKRNEELIQLRRDVGNLSDSYSDQLILLETRLREVNKSVTKLNSKGITMRSSGHKKE